MVVFAGPADLGAGGQDRRADQLVRQAMQAVGSVVGIAPPNEKDYVKRVIAVGGQTVMCCDAEGNVDVDGTSLNEPYIYEPIEFVPGELDCTTTPMSRRCFGPVTIPEGELWVMGDHRSDSADSSYQCQGMPPSSGAHCQGPIPVDNVIGKAIVHRHAAVAVGHHRQPRHRSRQPGELMTAPSSSDPAGRRRVQRQPQPVIRGRTCGWRRSCCATAATRLAAMDEVGRGALAGPVTVGVVVVTAGDRPGAAWAARLQAAHPGGPGALVGRSGAGSTE